MIKSNFISKERMKLLVKKALSFCKTKYALCVLFILFLAVFNGVLTISPHIEEAMREHRAKARFEAFWEKEGAQAFRDVGVEPTDKIHQEELDSYLDKYHEKNLPLVPEKHVERMKSDFKKWWETSGKESYVIEKNLVPDEKLYKAELYRYINAYTKNVLIYRLFFIPQESSIGALLTSWILFPGVFSFLLFAAGFLFATYNLNKRWGLAQTALVFIGSIIASGLVFAITLPLTYFAKYSEMPFTGASLPLAILLGAAAIGPKKDSVGTPITMTAIAIAAIDAVANWNLYPNLFGWVSLLTPPFFALGILLGKKLPRFTREGKIKRSAEKTITKDPIAEKKVRTRAEIKKGIELADKAEYALASTSISTAYSALLQEYPLDVEYIKKATEAIFYPNYFLEIPSVQWMEWGISASTKNLPEIAIQLFEKGIALETDKVLLRSAFYHVGELRLRHHIDDKKGKEELRKVLEANSQDILAAQAHKLLGE